LACLVLCSSNGGGGLFNDSSILYMIKTNNTVNQFKSLQILHKAFLLGQMLFGAVAFFLVWSNKLTPSLEVYNRPLQVVAVLLSFAGFYIGTIYLFKKSIHSIRESNSAVNIKLEKYRSACLIQWTLLEVPCLFAIICFLLVGNYSFMALAIMLMVLFTLMGASKAKAMLLLNLTEQDMQGL